MYPYIRTASVILGGLLAFWASLQKKSLELHLAELDLILIKLQAPWILCDRSGNIRRMSALASSLHLENVEFLGYLSPERQRAIWAQSAFSVIPSIWREPFGLVLVEAWAQARPCVAFRAGALEELIHHGVDGLLVDPLSPASLGKQIQFLIDRPSPCVSMGEAGRNRVLTEFAPATWSQKINHVLQKTLPISAIHDS